MNIRACSTWAAIAAAATALAACSSTASNAGTSPKSATASSPAEAGAPAGAHILGTTQAGKPFTISVPATSQPTALQLTVSDVTCGKDIDPAVVAFETSIHQPSPSPESGKQFCVVTMNAVNVGKSQAVWETSGTVNLNVGDTEYPETSTDANIASDYSQVKGNPGPPFGLNPGSKGPVFGVFEIPVGATPDSLWVANGTNVVNIEGVQPGYLVRLS